MKIYIMNLIVPLLAVLAIGAITGVFRSKRKESVKGEIFEYFKEAWEADEKAVDKDGDEPFFQKFFRLFIKAIEYEQYKESANKTKYYLYKLVVLLIVLSIPFLVLFLITRKEWVLNDAEWNNVYLYTVVLVPLIFAYLINKYIKIRKYHETWYRHMRNRHHMEWRMLVFVKDYELYKEGKMPEGSGVTPDTLKTAFINDMCEFWGMESDISVSDAAKEESIFSEISDLFK